LRTTLSTIYFHGPSPLIATSQSNTTQLRDVQEKHTLSDRTILVCSSPYSWTRVRIAGGVVVQAEQNTRVGPLVQRGASNTAGWRNRAAACHLQVQALGVELRAVIISSTVESNDLMADDVVASLEVPGDSCRRSEVVLDEFVCDPGSRTTWSDQSTLGDLGPAKGARSERRAVTIAWSDIVNDGALVCIWPGVPVELQVSTSGDTSVLLASSRALVTVDVVSASSSRLNKAIVLVQGVPTSSLSSLS